MNKQAQDILVLLKARGLTSDEARFALAQSANETANFSSQIFKENNNAFGMKYAGQALARGVKNGYAYYTSLGESASDLVRWVQYYKRFELIDEIESLNDYIAFLKRNEYFEADETEYYKNCLYYFNKYSVA